MKGRAAMALFWALLVPGEGSRAEVKLSIPRAACLKDPAGQFRPLLGLPGSYVLGEPVHSGALSVACGDRFTLLKGAEALEWLDDRGQLKWRLPAPRGPALFGVAAQDARAVVYFPAPRQWFLASEGGLRPLEVAFGGPETEVLSVALAGRDSIAAVVRRSGRYRFARAGLDGRVEEDRELAEVLAPVLVLENGAMAWGAGEGLVLQQPTGARRYVPLPAPPAELATAGQGGIYVQLAGGHGCVLVTLTERREEFYCLPEALW